MKLRFIVIFYLAGLLLDLLALFFSNAALIFIFFSIGNLLILFGSAGFVKSMIKVLRQQQVP